VRGREA